MENKITIQFENGEESICDVLCMFETDEHHYLALLPENGEEVFLYRYTETETGIELDNIETDEEYEKVADIFESILEEEHDYEESDCGCGCENHNHEEKSGCGCGNHDKEKKDDGCGCGNGCNC